LFDFFLFSSPSTNSVFVAPTLSFRIVSPFEEFFFAELPSPISSSPSPIRATATKSADVNPLNDQSSPGSFISIVRGSTTSGLSTDPLNPAILDFFRAETTPLSNSLVLVLISRFLSSRSSNDAVFCNFYLQHTNRARQNLHFISNQLGTANNCS
uniref:Uncharacterized protein n=1 Tax=Parascaris univalens TaxID=6257 RepID=A0A915BAG7_PARUN